MNIRLPNSLQTFPGTVTALPGQFQRADSRTRLLLGILGVVIGIALVWWLAQAFFAPAPLVRHTPAVPVRVAVAQRKTIVANESTIGTVVANATVQVTARVSGQMDKAFFKEGDTVHAGDVLFQLDPRPFKAALEQTKAAQARDQATLVSDRKDAARYSILAKTGAASAQQADQATAAARAMAATVASDRAMVDAAALNLTYARILSPVDGKTGAIMVQPGNLVTADATTPLVTITQIHPVKISFFLPQTDLPRIQQRMAKGLLSITITEHGPGGETLTAPVDFVGNAVDNRTGTIELRSTFANLNNSLVPGQLVDVNVALSQIDNATVVPHDAVNLGPASNFVYVVDKQMKVSQRPVDTLYDDGTIAAIKGNVKPGDTIVTDGQLRLLKGSTVAIKKGAKPTHQATEAPAGAQ